MTAPQRFAACRHVIICCWYVIACCFWLGFLALLVVAYINP